MKKILVVDDEFLIRYSLSHILQGESMEVVTVATGSEAVHEISCRSYDLCFLDIHLPDMSGMEIMKTIREASPPTKVIIMTGSEVTSDMLRDIQKNSVLLLSKPFDLFRVKEFVDRVLEQGKPLYRDETHVLRNYKAFEYWLMNDQRKYERRPVAKRIAYSAISPRDEQGAHDQAADVIDISEGGMCLRTRSPLAPGRVLKIVNQTNECAGAVRWSAGEDGAFRIGIQFLPSGGEQG